MACTPTLYLLSQLYCELPGMQPAGRCFFSERYCQLRQVARTSGLVCCQNPPTRGGDSPGIFRQLLCDFLRKSL